LSNGYKNREKVQTTDETHRKEKEIISS